MLALTLVAAACGGRDDSSKGSSSIVQLERVQPSRLHQPRSGLRPSTTAPPGISGDTIKIGTIRPASGPYAIYDQVTAGMEAYFKEANDTGGLKAGDGKKYKVELVKEDDGYDPARTPNLVKKLVEQDKVFGLVGDIGTETNLAIRTYMNDNCVPNIALATGSPEWGKANEFPWYIAALPSYATEAKFWVDYIKTVKPDAKIAILYQSDDFGQATRTPSRRTSRAPR